MSCKYCKESSFNTLIESSYEELACNVFGTVSIYENPVIQDNSLVFEMRNGDGYLRIGDRMEMNCIDHEKNFRINYCPMCGDKLVKEGINIQHMVLSYEDYNKLVEKYGEDVVEKNIEGLKNYSKAKKYKSAYLTLNKWCKRDLKSKDNGWGDVE